MSSLIKICGLKVHSQIEFIAQLNLNYIGLIHHPASKRHVEWSAIKAILTASKCIDKLCLVTVDLPLAQLNQLLELGIKNIQLHGSEDINYIQFIKERYPSTTIIKAFGIHSDFNWKQLNPLETTINYFLFDTYTVNHGGSGKAFDYSLISNYTLSNSYIISGGLHLDNIQTALKLSNTDPRCIGFDINSGVEENPGNKNLQKVVSIIKIIRENEHINH